MRIRILKSLGIVTFVAVGLLAPSVLAATAPEIYSVSEGRDATSSKPLVIITGKKLTKFKTFNLYESDATTFLGAPQWISATPATFVLGLPTNLPPGTYVLVASDGKGTDESLTITVGNGRPLPAAVSNASLDPGLRTDLDDAATLEGNTAAYFTNASNLSSGTVSTNRFSAYDDLVAESKVGTGAGQLATGNHNHDNAYAAIGHNHDTVYAKKEFIGAKVYLTADAGWGSQAAPKPGVAFDAEEFDTDGCHDAINPSRLTAKTPGYYTVRFAVTMPGQVGAPVKFRKNSSFVTTNQINLPQSGNYSLSFSTTIYLAQGDYVEVVFDTGYTGTMNGGQGITEFSFVREGD